MNKYLFLILSTLIMNCSETQNSALLEEIINNLGNDFPDIVSQPKKHRLQVLYTQIDRDKYNRPTFTTHGYRVSEKEYFYPASTTKLPVAALALEKANLNSKINPYMRLEVLTEKPELGGEFRDLSSESGYPSIAHYLRKLFIISDNTANNRLYEFLGRDHINQRIWDLGYPNTRVRHRLSIHLSDELNGYTNPFTFYANGQKVYEQPSKLATLDLSVNYNDYLIGQYHVSDGEKIKGPMDFSSKNFMSLKDQHAFMKQIVFPESVPNDRRLALSDDDYSLLYREMSILPRQSKYPKYKSSYYDSYCKFFMYGDSRDTIPDHIKILNKVGQAYGFILDNAYIIDLENKVEFILTAVVYHNNNETINDNNYEYESISIPFLAKLGRLIHNFEQDRTKEHLPVLDRYIK